MADELASFRAGIRAGVSLAYQDALAQIEEWRCGIEEIAAYLTKQVAIYRDTGGYMAREIARLPEQAGPTVGFETISPEIAAALRLRSQRVVKRTVFLTRQEAKMLEQIRSQIKEERPEEPRITFSNVIGAVITTEGERRGLGIPAAGIIVATRP